MLRERRTTAKVKAVNRAHKTSMEIWQTMHEIFSPLVGEKIDKADGTFLAKIAKLLPKLPHDHSVTVIRAGGPYSLAWSITCNEPIGDSHGHLYYGITTYIGHLNDGILTGIKGYDMKLKLRTDYTVKELLDKRDACKVAKSAYEAARSACWPFDEEYDN